MNKNRLLFSAGLSFFIIVLTYSLSAIMVTPLTSQKEMSQEEQEETKIVDGICYRVSLID